MTTIPEQQRDAVREELKREFSRDPMMQELHWIRRIHQLETQGMTPEQRREEHRAAS